MQWTAVTTMHAGHGSTDANLAEKFVIRIVAQFIERRQIRSAVSVAASAVDHRVNALAIRRLDVTAPRAGGRTRTVGGKWQTFCPSKVNEISFLLDNLVL